MKTHFTAETKGGGADREIASGFENQYRFRLFFSGGIDEGLSYVRGPSGKRDTMSLLLRASDEGGFGRSKEVLGCLSGEKRRERACKCEGEKKTV